jgi:hydrogenase-4 component B
MTAVVWEFVAFFVLCVSATALSLVVPRSRVAGLIAWLGSLAGIVLLVAGVQALLQSSTLVVRLWSISNLGSIVLGVDRLSAVFVCVTALVTIAVSLFSGFYVSHSGQQYSVRLFASLYFMLIGAIALIVLCRDVVSFLLAWEAMTIASYLLVAYEYRQPENVKASYLMLSISEAGTLAIAAAFLLLANNAHSLEFSAMAHASSLMDPGMGWAVFLLSFFGFAVKAGLLPVNSWLPHAHPAAPGTISALLSGVILNLGIYGIILVNAALSPIAGVGPGLVVLIVGAASAVTGILYATIENDMKRMLAYSSIENMGIVTVGLGAAFVFGALNQPIIASIAFVAALYHLTNHSIYKTLLFLGASAIDVRVGIRDLDLLGGLRRFMPWTAALFLVGALSISAIPPFNGFASEWLTLQMMLRSAQVAAIPVKIVFVLCGVALALTAALAITCFVKAFATSFLGLPRSAELASAREVPRSAIASMGILAALCFLLGVLPTYVVPVFSATVEPLAHARATDAIIPAFFEPSAAHPELPAAFVTEFHDLGAQIGRGVVPGRGLVILLRGGSSNPVVFAVSTTYMVLVLALLLILTFVGVRLVARAPKRTRRAPWAGGLSRLLPEMTYTATGFSNPVRVIFEAVFQPTVDEDTPETVATHFRTAITRTREDVFIVDRLFHDPLVSTVNWLASLCARAHRGRVNSYAGYGLIALLLALILVRFS